MLHYRLSQEEVTCGLLGENPFTTFSLPKVCFLTRALNPDFSDSYCPECVYVMVRELEYWGFTSIPSSLVEKFLTRADWPTAGDAVQLTGDWMEASSGDIGIIGGIVGRRMDILSITFRYSAFRGTGSAFQEGPLVVSCSGGPATISLPVENLKSTRMSKEIQFWKWKESACADGGIKYTIPVRVWCWDGVDRFRKESK